MIRRKTAILVVTQLLQVPELGLSGSELTNIRSTKRRKPRKNKRLMTKHLQKRRGTIRRHWRKRRSVERKNLLKRKRHMNITLTEKKKLPPQVPWVLEPWAQMSTISITTMLGLSKRRSESPHLFNASFTHEAVKLVRRTRLQVLPQLTQQTVVRSMSTEMPARNLAATSPPQDMRKHLPRDMQARRLAEQARLL
jgi:hypothetical protein